MHKHPTVTVLHRLYLFAILILICGSAHAVEPPAVTLAESYEGHVDATQYWVSEKYDGVRGYWNGEQLVSCHDKIPVTGH